LPIEDFLRRPNVRPNLSLVMVDLTGGIDKNNDRQRTSFFHTAMFKQPSYRAARDASVPPPNTSESVRVTPTGIGSTVMTLPRSYRVSGLRYHPDDSLPWSERGAWTRMLLPGVTVEVHGWGRLQATAIVPVNSPDLSAGTVHFLLVPPTDHNEHIFRTHYGDDTGPLMNHTRIFKFDDIWYAHLEPGATHGFVIPPGWWYTVFSVGSSQWVEQNFVIAEQDFPRLAEDAAYGAIHLLKEWTGVARAPDNCHVVKDAFAEGLRFSLSCGTWAWDQILTPTDWPAGMIEQINDWETRRVKGKGKGRAGT
jgi:hypothetical protein